MDLKYFKIYGEITENVIKKQWRKIALDNHPDKGGVQAVYVEAQTEYEMLQGKIGVILNDNPENYNNWNDFFAHVSVKVNAAYQALSEIPQIREIEICGTWIWVDLDKNEIDAREKLKSIEVEGIKFRFHRVKKTWYFAGQKSTARRKYTMEEIRTLHGSKTYKKEDLETIAA